MTLQELEREARSLLNLGGWDDPQWEHVGKLYDWRNYVPPVVRDAWGMINKPGRIAIYLIACAQADREEWE